jgi:hypothetical protein
MAGCDEARGHVGGPGGTHGEKLRVEVGDGPGAPRVLQETGRMTNRPPSSLVPQVSWPFIGREDELEWVAAVRRERRCCGVVISGAAGVGKTRLAREALAGALGEVPPPSGCRQRGRRRRQLVHFSAVEGADRPQVAVKAAQPSPSPWGVMAVGTGTVEHLILGSGRPARRRAWAPHRRPGPGRIRTRRRTRRRW